MKKLLYLLLALMIISVSCEEESDNNGNEEIEPLRASYEVTDVTEYGGNDGTITVTATGGETPYFFVLNPYGSQTTGEFTELTAGTYKVNVYDSTGDSVVFNDIVIEEPSVDNIVINISVENVSTYNENDGIATITASGGISPYSYKLNDNSYVSTNVFENLVAGDYTVTVKDSRDSTKTKDFAITQPDYVPLSIVNTVINDNDVTVTVNGGVKPYTYGIDDVYQTETNDTVYTYTINENELIGKHIIMVKDDLDSVITDTITIGYTGMNMSITKTDVDIYGENTGSITVDVSDGYGEYQYKLNDGSFLSTNVFNDLYAGDYTVYVKDNVDTISETVTITQPDVLVATAEETGAGEITVNATGGVGGYTYKILLPDSTFQESNVFTNLPDDTYRFVVQDANGALDTTDYIGFTTHPELQIGDEYLGGVVFEVSGEYPYQSGKVVYNEDWSGNYNFALSKENDKWKLPSIKEVQDVQLVIHNNPTLTTFDFINLYFLYWTNEIDTYYSSTDYYVFVSKINEDTTPYQSTRHINSTIRIMLIANF